MNSETSQNPFPTSSSMGSSATSGGSSGSTGSSGAVGTSPQAERKNNSGSGDMNETVHRMAQKVHEAVDRMEQTLGSSSERVMGMQQEYGDYAREQVRGNPLAAVGVAFVAGIVFSKLFMR